MPRSKAECNPGLAKGPDGRWLPKLTPAQKEAVAFGYPELSMNEVAAKFGISKTAAIYLRHGRRGMVVPGDEGTPVSLRLGKMRRRSRLGEAKLAHEFLRRAVPLLRAMLLAKAELQAKGRTDVSLDPVGDPDEPSHTATYTIKQRERFAAAEVGRPEARRTPGLAS